MTDKLPNQDELRDQIRREFTSLGVSHNDASKAIDTIMDIILQCEQQATARALSMDKVNRFEVINHYHDTDEHGSVLPGGTGGRELVLWKPDLKVDLSVQDNSRTLKVFLSNKEYSS